MSGKSVIIPTGCDACHEISTYFTATGKLGICGTHGLPSLIEETGGKKFDTGKPPMSLLSGAALTEVAKVLEFGAKKYAAHNWKGGFAWSRLASAALRHLFAWIGGEDKDPETGLSHLAHCSCCLMFLLDFEVNHLGQDDRYKAPPVS